KALRSRIARSRVSLPGQTCWLAGSYRLWKPSRSGSSGRSRGLPGKTLQHFGMVLDEILDLVALLGREDSAHRLQFLLANGLALLSLCCIFVGEPGVNGTNIVSLVGAQPQFVAKGLNPFRDRLFERGSGFDGFSTRERALLDRHAVFPE